MSDPVRRPFNYYGSKQRLCRQIHALIPLDVDTTVEPFCGTAIFTLSKPRHLREVVNDLDGRIVGLFDVLRDPVLAAELYRRIDLTPYAEELLRRVYRLPPTDDPVESAWRFLVAMWFGRGGDNHKTGFRWSKGQNTAPERTWAGMPERLQAVANRLRGVCIRRDDALKILADYDEPNCLLYCDPPYAGEVGRRYAVKMTREQHYTFAARLRTSRAKVILSMNPGTLYDEVLADWHRTEVLVTGGKSAKKTDLLLSNFAPLPLLREAA